MPNACAGSALTSSLLRAGNPIQGITRSPEMQSLYAAVDSAGTTRYVGDVPRGAACGCFCACCGSPLVARCGSIREWHFAHEAKQERPECLAGATNLLRRTAIEWLQSLPTLRLPEYIRSVTSTPPLPPVTEIVAWKDWPRQIRNWHPTAAHTEPVARIEMNTGLQVEVYVVIGDRRTRDEDPNGDFGIVEYWIPAPVLGQIRHVDDALAHAASNGSFTWIYQPDVHGLIARVQRDVDTRAAKVKNDRTFFARATGFESFESPQPSRLNIASPWDNWRAPKSSFILYRSNSSAESWLHVRHRDQRAVMVPWPKAWEGWDEFFPAKYAHLDLELGGMVLDQEVNAMLLVSRSFTGGTRNYSSFAEIPGSEGTST